MVEGGMYDNSKVTLFKENGHSRINITLQLYCIHSTLFVITTPNLLLDLSRGIMTCLLFVRQPQRNIKVR